MAHVPVRRGPDPSQIDTVEGVGVIVDVMNFTELIVPLEDCEEALELVLFGEVDKGTVGVIIGGVMSLVGELGGSDGVVGVGVGLGEGEGVLGPGIIVTVVGGGGGGEVVVGGV